MTSPLRLRAPIVLPCDPRCSVIRSGVVDVDRKGRITYVGPEAEAPAIDQRALKKDFTGILMPGLINAHAHTPMTVLRGLGGDVPLLSWLNDHIWPAEAKMRPTDVKTGMLLGSLEMLRNGITTTAEMYFHGEQIADAVLNTGARVLIAPAIIAFPGAPGGSWQSMIDEVSNWIDADGLRFGPGERIELGYGPHSAYMLPPEALTAVAGEAKRRGALVQIHVAESAQEDVQQRELHGSVPLLLEKVGILDGRMLGAHCVQLSDTDIKVMRRPRVGIAHCPTSNAKLAAGIARLQDLEKVGIPVGLGTDGPASNDRLDIWDEMRMAGLLARLKSGDAAALTAQRALLLATFDAAAALGRQDIGSLAQGRWADIIHVDVDSPAFATGLDVPDTQLLSNLVWAGSSRAVTDVWVAGAHVVSDGEPQLADRQAAARAVGDVARRLRNS
ncbi:amidohydrolase [Pseudonocardiaceae bacterium YIM PH 21723]|nr:amidohydrolase [Pseudonocardiaceae bacterium YIM PH 21723]